MSELRRDPESVFAAHYMDPDRCELYVEGPSDRRFLNWLVGRARHANAIVHEIDVINLPHVATGGQRGRVLAFAQLADASRVQSIRCFVDADMDRLLERPVPPNVWLTDGRDLESYVLCTECIDKAWRLGVGSDEVDADVLLAEVLRVAVEVADLRFAAHADALDLPFQDTELRKHTSVADRRLTFDRESYLRAVFQNASMPINRVPAFLERSDQLAASASHDVLQYVHGKDAFDLLTELMKAEGVSRADAPRLVWASFDKSLCDRHDNLTRVTRYLETRQAA